MIADERSVAYKPDGLTFTQAATLPVVGLTAYQAVTKAGKFQPGQHIFINGCLGGVGRIAVQVATGMGATVAGSCRSGSEAEARQLDVVFDTAGMLLV